MFQAGGQCPGFIGGAREWPRPVGGGHPNPKRSLRAACLIPLAMLGGASAALAAPGDVSGTMAQSRAVITPRTSFIKTRDLDFGVIAAGGQSGTVTIAPDGTRTATGGVILAGEGGYPAEFAGYGFRNQFVLISVGSRTGTLVRQGGAEQMRFDTFVIGSTPEAQLGTAPLSFRIGSQNGMFSFPVGATLRVGRRQAAGYYRGEFTVILQYQ